MKKLIIVFSLFILASPALANWHPDFTIVLENNTKVKMNYLVYWVDHNFSGYPNPVNIAGGEIGAGEKQDLQAKYQYGRYFVAWFSSVSPTVVFYFKPYQGITGVILRPEDIIGISGI